MGAGIGKADFEHENKAVPHLSAPVRTLAAKSAPRMASVREDHNERFEDADTDADVRVVKSAM